MDKETIYDIPTTARLKKLKKLDLWNEFDDEMVEDYRDYMSWFMQREHNTLLSMPRPKKGDFIPVEMDESGHDVSQFNTCDFQNGKPKFDRYGYRIRKVMERVGDLAMQHSCIRSKEGREGVRKMFESLMKSEFLIEALDALNKGDTWKAKRLYKRVDECAKVWDEWNPS